jgi:TRAP-type uncharacterized transport system substrate-binding protein
MSSSPSSGVERTGMLSWIKNIAGFPRSWILASLSVAFGYVLATVLAQLPGPPPRADAPRTTFEIVTGAAIGSNIRIAAMMAGVLSNPPGVSRCDRAVLCGPPGLIPTTRATQGAVANLLAVEAGAADSAIAEGNMVGRAVAGQEPFRRSDRAQSLRTIAKLYGESVHLVAARRA